MSLCVLPPLRAEGQTLPIESKERKSYPIARGAMAYFPAAIAGVALHSATAGARHTESKLEHRRWLSSDHDDCIERHLMDIRDMEAQRKRAGLPLGDTDPVLAEANALAWRALALSQELHEAAGYPLAPAARLKEGDTV